VLVRFQHGVCGTQGGEEVGGCGDQPCVGQVIGGVEVLGVFIAFTDVFVEVADVVMLPA